jgi:hypothetical protein
MRGLAHCLLIAVVLTFLAAPTAVAQTAIGVGEGEGQMMFSIDLATGTATLIGGTGFLDVEGISFQPGTGVLFGADDETDALLTCSTTTGACTVVGPLGVGVSDPGMAFTCDGTLYIASEDEEGSPPNNLYRVNPTTGAATLVGSLGTEFDGMSLAYSPTAAGCSSGMWALDGNDNPPTLGCVNLTTGAVTVIGSIGIPMYGQPAIEFDANGVLWVVEEDDPGTIAQVNPVTGVATDVGYPIDGATAYAFIEGLASPVVCAAQAEAVPVLSGKGMGALAALLALAGAAAVRRA